MLVGYSRQKYKYLKVKVNSEQQKIETSPTNALPLTMITVMKNITAWPNSRKKIFFIINSLQQNSRP